MIIDAIHLYSAAEISTNPVSFAQLSLNHADLTQSYIVQEAFGLDADEIVPSYYGGFSTDKFHNMSLKSREVTLRIKLNPQYASSQTPSSLRDALYKLIAYSRTGLVELRFMNGATQVANIRGFIKKFEAALFSENPEVQITISCPYPFLRGPDTIELAGASGVTVPNPTLVDSLSNAPHGFKMRLTTTGTVGPTFTIQGKYGSGGVWPFSMTGLTFSTGAVIWFSSEEDDKYFYYVYGGITTHISDLLLLNQVWPIMFPGSTQLGFSSSNFTINSITFRPHYWGV